MYLSKELWEIIVQNFRNLVCFRKSKLYCCNRIQNLCFHISTCKIGLFVAIGTTERKRLRCWQEFWICSWLHKCLKYAKLRLWSFIISNKALLYLIKTKFQRFSFCVTVEQLFYMLDIIIVSWKNLLTL